MEFQVYELPSGIRCIMRRVKSAVVYSSLTVNVGTRDEKEDEHGVAHLIEHLMFKGTERRKIYHINSLLDNVGGELNAYTSKEETVVHSTVLKKDFVKAVDLISDIIFHSTYPEKEFSKEISVIIDEINAYRDSPSDLIFDDFEDLVFAGSSLGRNILGTKQRLHKCTREGVVNFIESNYATDKMVFAVVGNISFDRFKTLCDKYLGDVPKRSCSAVRVLPPEYIPTDKTIDKHTFQTHSIIGSRAPSFCDKKRIPLTLLLNILGGSSANSRLSLVLREKYGLTYNVESNLTTYQDTGLWSIYFSADAANVAKCRDLIRQELDVMMRSKLTRIQLHTAQRQLIGQMTISSESGENYMLSAARSFMLYGTVQSNEEIANTINSITADEVLSVANEFFREENLSTLTYR